MGNEWLIHGRKRQKLVYLFVKATPAFFESKGYLRQGWLGGIPLTHQTPSALLSQQLHRPPTTLTIFQWRTSTTTVTTPHFSLPRSLARIRSCSPRRSPLRERFVTRKYPVSPVVGPRPPTSQDSWPVHQAFLQPSQIMVRISPPTSLAFTLRANP